LRRRLALARKIHRILKDRLSLLVNEYLVHAREAIEKRSRVVELLAKSYDKVSLALGMNGLEVCESIASILPKYVTILVATRNILGLSVPVLESKVKPPLYPLYITSSYVDDAVRTCRELLPELIELAELEKTMERLSLEIIKMRRRVNALEYIVIPRIEATIKYLRMKFEEREREDKARLKRIKVVLSRRRGS